MIVVEQPAQYGSPRAARSLALVCAFRGPLPTDPTAGRWHFACFGNKRHYQRATGICVHVEELAERLGDWHRRRACFLPFGENHQPKRRP